MTRLMATCRRPIDPTMAGRRGDRETLDELCTRRFELRASALSSDADQVVTAASSRAGNGVPDPAEASDISCVTSRVAAQLCQVLRDTVLDSRMWAGIWGTRGRQRG